MRALACSLPFLLPAAFLAQAPARHLPVTPRYTIADRGPTLVRTLVNTPGLNPEGDVAIWHTTPDSGMEGLVFHVGQTLKIDGDKDFSHVFPADLNSQRTVTGLLQSPQDLRFTRAFEWADNRLTLLGGIGGPYSAATAINQAGDIAGHAQIAGGERHAVRWRAGQPLDLGVLEHGDYSSARDLNDRGDIVGEGNVVPQGKPRAFLWHAGRMHTLKNLPGGTFCSAQAVNSKGEIAGWCDLPNGTTHGVLWRQGRITDLGTLGDDDSPSTALDINASRQIVGSSEIADSKLRAFLWQDGSMLNLNQALPPKSGWLLLVASRINDRGEIVGRGYFHGAIHTFLLQPDRTAPTRAR